MKPFPILVLVAGLAACTAAPERDAGVRAPAARVTGPAVSCLDTYRVSESLVHDDYTIDFRVNGGQTYRNTLPYRCSGLGFEKRFGYVLSIPRLCSLDVITVLYSDGARGASCGLGPFVPVEVAR
ncbi:MAG: hypothetical protein ABIP41_08190 [Croceibacterium sp.]